MWSGPRTLSTALMRSFGNRPDTVVVDEPLYGFYLARTGLDHPGRDEVIASMPTDWRVVIEQLVRGSIAAPISYQKHMTHHLLPEVDRSLLAGMRHAYLIRDPRLLLASYARVRQAPTLADLGLEQQVEIFRLFGGPVIDAADLAARPRETLGALCAALAIPFDEAMLAWPPGPRPTDGVWGKYWYARVWASTGFTAPREPLPASPAEREPIELESAGLPPELPPELESLAARCRPFYAELSDTRLAARRSTS